jgi:hypothetical protein
MKWISQVFQGFKSTDMLEISTVSHQISSPQYQVYPYKKEKREILSSTHAFSFIGLSAQ